VGKSSGNRLLLDQALSGLPGRPQAIYETQHVTTMLGLVEAGLGVAVVPSLAMPGADHPLLVSVPLVDPIVTRRVGLIRRKGRPLSPAAQQLYQFFGEMKGKRRNPRGG
jgi:DNA-binding transcriptional LysR family regulator